MRLITGVHKVATKTIRFAQRLLGASTVGVRAIVINEANEVLLVKHTYQAGWYLPGGGVDQGETPKAATIRELKEEAGIIVHQEPILLGIYFHKLMGVSDYPILYEVKKYSQIASHSYEIAQHGFFAYDNLPDDTSPGTRRRLKEYFEAIAPVDYW